MSTPKKQAPPLTEDDVRELVKARWIAVGSMAALAREWGISTSYLSFFLGGRQGPGPAILGPLGLSKVETVSYVKATGGGK